MFTNTNITMQRPQHFHALINKIYDVERRAADMNVDERGVLRATETGMYLDRLREWLDGPVAASLLPPEQAGKYIQLYPQSVVSEASFESHSKASSWASPPDLATPQKNQPMLRVRLPSATLRELSERFGLSHPDSASDLIRRGAKRIEQSSEAIRQQKAIEKKLNPESRT